jgi:hypothetical protein
MNGSRDDAEVLLQAQIQHQVRLTRRRMTWWIPAIFAVGLCVSILGLIPSITASLERGSPGISVFVYGAFTLFFGWVVIHAVLWPFLLRPRIVPYFKRELGPYGGAAMNAFPRGRALYREIAALDGLAKTLGVEPLSAFGFAYDYYEQQVQWHSASAGLRTAEALRQGVRAQAASDLVQDLDALASVLRVAVERAIEFSLVVRLHAKDSMQGVCTREVRQGSFW